jgi:predicted cupin superfamily sugar epimerase
VSENPTVSKIVNDLQLIPHEEGGYWSSIERDESAQNSYSLINYLLAADDFSSFHRLSKSDETLMLKEGQAVKVIIISPAGTLTEEIVSSNNSVTVPHHSWFAITPLDKNKGYSLITCKCVPAFDYNDFELANRDSLITLYSEHKHIIQKFTRS